MDLLGEKKRLLAIFGTRPEAVKMGPLLLELRNRDTFQLCVCITGQHRQMLDAVWKDFQIQPDYDLKVMRPGQSLSQVTCQVLEGVEAVLHREKPDMVLVCGDTATTFAAALASFYEKIPVAHVEAGLRTWDTQRPWPEEMYRRAVTAMSTIHFAPTQQARENLLRDSVPAEKIKVTGNTVIDALRMTIRDQYSHPILDWAGGCRLLMITAHRRENLGKTLENMLSAVRRAVEERPDVKAVFPVHLNPIVIQTVRMVLQDCSQIRLVEPMQPVDFHNILARCYGVITDSGGIQEEAPGLHVPALVMRDLTERPEGVQTGAICLAGTDQNRVYQALCRLLDQPELHDRMARAANPYGDGFASRRIAEELEKFFQLPPQEQKKR